MAARRGLDHGGHAQQVGEGRQPGQARLSRATPSAPPETSGPDAEDPVRHRQARRARAPGDARAHGARLPLRGGGPPHHGRRADDDLLDRPAPDGRRGRRAHRHPGPVRGRRAGDRGPLGRAGPRRARPICATCPSTSGRRPRSEEYGAHDIRIFAEINNVPYLPREEVVRAAEYYRQERRRRRSTSAARSTGSSTTSPTSSGSSRREGFTPQHRHPRPASRSSPPTGPASTTC